MNFGLRKNGEEFPADAAISKLIITPTIQPLRLRQPRGEYALSALRQAPMYCKNSERPHLRARRMSGSRWMGRIAIKNAPGQMHPPIAP